ncbi:TPA: hypothetical protein JIF01_000546 [Acinetobacter baumannii]|nr:hypothetical protein [Acinetobacter baumannii]
MAHIAEKNFLNHLGDDEHNVEAFAALQSFLNHLGDDERIGVIVRYV